MAVQFANRATTLLASSIEISDTAIALSSGTGSRFPSLGPGEWFPVVVVDASGNVEIMKATGRSGDILTVQRAQEGTSAQAFNAGARVDLRLTAAALSEIILNATANNSDVEGDTLADALNWLFANKVDKSAYDQNALVPAGTVVFTLRNTAPTSWLMFNDGTFGSASSGANYANADAQTLFEIMFNVFSDSNAPIRTSSGSATTRAAQGSAAAAWAANCRMTLPRALGRALAVAGNGSGLTNRQIGAFVGAETHALIIDEMPAHNHTINDPGHRHSYDRRNLAGNVVGGSGNSNSAGGLSEVNSGLSTTGITINSRGGGQAHNNMQPTLFLNAMVKL